jgi:transitional endoplasmic reticulum ATPase
VGESERELETIFRKAIQVAPCVVLLDEVESIAPVRGTTPDSGVSQRIVSQLLREIDKTKEFKDLIIVATTNRMDLVDPALIRSGRFDYVVSFTAPEEEDRIEILEIHAKDMGIRPADLKKLAKMTEGLVGSDIGAVCRRARLEAIEKRLSSVRTASETAGSLHVDMKDFQRAVNEIRARLNASRPIRARNPGGRDSG